MTTRKTTTDVPFTAEQMFDLVADVEKYPEFIPYCIGLRVVSNNAEEGIGAITADMLVAYKVFREKFRSRAQLDRMSGRIDVEYVDGPFRHLNNKWRFTNRPQGGSTVEFEIAFEFRNLLLQATARNVFEKAFVKMTDAFVARAERVYALTPA